MLPFRTPFLAPYAFPNLLWRVNTLEKHIYLTFDDGPIPGLTEWVLEQLKTHEANATFFCVGENIARHSSIFRQIISEGHTVGNHTQHHLNGKNTPKGAYLADVQACDATMQQLQVSSKWFRPPYGRLTRAQRKPLLKEKKVVMWDVLTQDYDQSLSAETILTKSIQATRKGSVVVFHDNLKAEKNLKKVLPKYIDYFKQAGYQFKAL
ncbi:MULTISPECIES: polysaccharide deacetylase family protein [Roseivirga]|jgi:peptidoglycan/xylan/chitin deacetylase (PgdA/CDA1 family)|uniref:Polysaccharide deacetylase n=1 Tax=Roseivirga thermotolerans TaxID=1758176 RepID=A0ABQ3I9K6_9BACT|nr:MULTISPECIES: polysaccharide deacetylase family protein [Roseivirga]MEC7752536.1 polysaccharide deacetylase family protein [Bacteroidota bacterium]GHE67272.1 polysaccharide deacetylase [Roseivirga thermotolerans]|tara:strand:+ start:2336 stop:2959 length:624 start_codon:yes stop_codon:yes gene_type:complete